MRLWRLAGGPPSALTLAVSPTAHDLRKFTGGGSLVQMHDHGLAVDFDTLAAGSTRSELFRRTVGSITRCVVGDSLDLLTTSATHDLPLQ